MDSQWLILFFINLCLIISVVFLERKKQGEALLWVTILSFLPIYGILLYFIFGSTVGIKLAYKIRDRRLNERYRQMAVKQLTHLREERLSAAVSEENEWNNLAFFNLNYSHSVLTTKNRVKILTTGMSNYKNMFSDIQNAKESIHILYYSIHNDEIGHFLIELLTKKAREGLQIKVLYDGFGSFMTPSGMFLPLVRAGGSVKRIKPTMTHYRNHRKIVVIDGLIGYTGGMNIGRKYINLDKKKKPWRDTQIRLEGDAVYALQYFFMYDWFYASAPSKVRLRKEQLAKLLPLHQIRDFLPCQIVGSGADTDEEYIKMCYLKMIMSAKKKILLQSPYFIPDDTILEAFKVAAASGTEIIIMLPKEKASFFLNPVTNYYISQLLNYGIKVYLYHGYIHAKTLSIDGYATCIGTVNMDNRSLKIDDEICAVFYDRAFTARHQRIFDEDLRHCEEMNYEAFRQRSRWERIKERFFLLFAPLM